MCTILTATTVLYICPDILGLSYAPFKAVLIEGYWQAEGIILVFEISFCAVVYIFNSGI